ncbi:hypothetical protein [Paraliobacillus sp. X-1268]|uniref:hypothetical protein n=1 Tax=Paraliobacillus sp. X-1268 TaxID=2213193 RepID=UPI000E3E3511|nr:hypothetical protein [Paraliobacillus sp. X-1268]
MDMTFKGYECELKFGKYRNGNTAIQLHDKEDASRVAIATVNGEFQPSEGVVGIKDWSENHGMVDALISANVIEQDLQFIEPTGFVAIEYYKLSEVTLQEIEIFKNKK